MGCVLVILLDKYCMKGPEVGYRVWPCYGQALAEAASRSAPQTDDAKRPGTCQQRRLWQQFWCRPLAQRQPRKAASED